MKARILVIVLLLSVGAYFVHTRMDTPMSTVQALGGFPPLLDEWRSVGQVAFDSRTLSVLRPTDYLFRQYEGKNGRQLGLYIGFHGGGKGAGPIHSPRNCLPGSGWLMLSSSFMSVDTPAGPVQLVRATYAKGEEGAVYYYWYQVRGHSITDDFALKVAELRNAFLDGRRDAAFIRLDVPLEQEKGADEAVAAFIARMYPVLLTFLPS